MVTGDDGHREEADPGFCLRHLGTHHIEVNIKIDKWTEIINVPISTRVFSSNKTECTQIEDRALADPWNAWQPLAENLEFRRIHCSRIP